MGIKVANIIEDGRFGGAQVRIIAVAEKLRNKGIETIVVLPKDNSEIMQLKLSQKKLQTIIIRLHRISRNFKQIIIYFYYFIPEIIWLVTILKREKVDIVHCNGSWQVKGIIAGKLARKKTIWHFNDTRRIRIIDRFSLLAGKYFCDGFIFAAKRVKDYYSSKKSIARKFHFDIQEAVDTRRFDSERVKPEEKLKKNESYTVVTIGNINPAKGIEYFIEMACLLNDQFKNLRFYIVGPHFIEQEKYSRKLKAMIQKSGGKNIFFKGWVEDVRPILKAADVYVCSSIHEASPISVWEAMAMGKPIVSTDVGDVARFILDGENGFIIPIRSSRLLADKVGILLLDEKLRKKFSIKARKVALKCLDIDICVKKHIEAYRNLLTA